MIKKDLEIYNKEIVQVPNCVLYPHQKNAWTGFNKVLKEYPKGLKLIILEWHRRAGKDIMLIQMLVKEAIKKPGNYLSM